MAIPTSLPAASDSKISDVAIGRNQRAAITEDGKLIFWEVRRFICFHKVKPQAGESVLTVYSCGSFNPIHPIAPK